jgi:E3 ubiquitin-protein ligase BRE1
VLACIGAVSFRDEMHGGHGGRAGMNAFSVHLGFGYMQDAEARLKRARETGLKSEQLDELNEECAAMKRIICCSVCNKKPKQVVLSKCWHLFCHDCIKLRLGQRARKCPTCGIAFGAADVHEVFM